VRRDPPGAGRLSRLSRLVGLTGLVLALAAGCGGEASAEGGDQDLFDGAPDGELQLDMLDIAFSVDEIGVRTGEIVAITIENSGALVHDITLESPGTRSGYRVLDGDPMSQDPPRRSTAHLTLRPGSTAELRLEVAEPGEYEYYCSVPGHRGAGMRGILTVG
jgi:uncharacterized cupredoxin-like copper-binding protein